MKTLKTKNIIALCLLITMLFSNIAFADEVKKDLTLDEAINVATENSVELVINNMDIEVKKLELSEAERKERKYDKLGFSLGTIDGFYLDENMFSKKAEYALEEQKMKEDYIKENIKLNVTNAYYGVLQARDNVKITEDTVKNIERNYEILKKKFDIGQASKSELYIAEISLNDAKIKLSNAKDVYNKAIRALNMILNYPLDTKLNLTSNYDNKDFNANLEEDLKHAYEKRFDMIQINNNYEIVKLDFKVNAGSYTPNTYQYKYKERTVSKIKELLDNSKKNVEFDLKNKFDEIETAKREIITSDSTVKKAEENLRITELSYTLDNATILDVKEAIVQLDQAKLGLSNAIANLNSKILEYLKAKNIGNL